MTHESRKEEINSNFQIFFELSDTYKYIFIKTRNTTQCQKTQLPQKPLSLLSSTSTNNRDHSLKRHSSRNETPESSSLKNFISPRIPFYKRNTVAGISDSSRNFKTNDVRPRVSTCDAITTRCVNAAHLRLPLWRTWKTWSR